MWWGQAWVVMASAVEVWAWHALPTHSYNILWTVCDLGCAYFEFGLAGELVWNLWLEFDTAYALLFSAVAFHLILWWTEYRAWLDFLNVDGAWLAEMREWANLGTFPVALWAMYAHRSASARRSNHERQHHP